MPRSPFIRLHDPESLPPPFRQPVLAIGNFDGLHLGHAALLGEARALAGRHGAPAGLLTFSPHPRRVLSPERPFFPLTSEDDRAHLARRAGLDGLVTLTFDRALMALSPEAFARDLLSARLGVSGVVTGEGFRYGAGRAGDAGTLAEAGRRLGFAVAAVPPVSIDGEVVSSSAIRRRLAAGDVAGAARLLGYRWFVRGVVRHGDKRGRELGFPTANLSLDAGVALAHGIYAVRVHVDGAAHDGVASFGRRPTFDDGAPKLESFIFDFSRDIYGREITVELVGRIRPELKFDSIEALVARMVTDCEEAKRLLREVAGDGVASAV
jgi:riboflavin kinase/FMN adenylyltransferase